ncbi:hypothetical protein HHK36_016211 [Tetracentron sinense]|uniref:Protein root UVB sensitive 5 n=1 Tax=Tetracentron sinense TaxID=13715 RepID=A0A834Z339_TETSI|nr:hypothetical protein HHK36_016211 [Tetracentron sinense]
MRGSSEREAPCRLRAAGEPRGEGATRVEREARAAEARGFHSSTADPYLFLRVHNPQLIILLLYVDDIVLTGSDMAHVHQLISQLQQEFDMKDLVSSKLPPSDSPLLSDPTEYRKIVGALQYLSFSRPDLVFSFNQVCQYMHAPTAAHFTFVKRILRESYRQEIYFCFSSPNSHSLVLPIYLPKACLLLIMTAGVTAKHMSPIQRVNWFSCFPSGRAGCVSTIDIIFMNWKFRTIVLGKISISLPRCQILDAVGVGSFSGTTVAASAAAIRWVSKDGIGAIGRLFIGGRFGNLFDDDPKQWRMYADFIGSIGSIFDLSTPLYPGYFLPLASLGNLAKAVARGLKDPSFRVIQNHFATSGNLGEVAAKEEVWEVAAQLIGLALGILVLAAPGLLSSYPVLASTWLSMRLLHLWLRYQSLSVLRFNTINLKRARMLVQSHVVNSTVPGYVDCNRKENILSWERFLKPRIIFGVSLEEMIGGDRSSSTLKELLNLYAKEKYILIVNQHQERDFEVFVSFKVGATSLSVLRCIWQSYWLHEHGEALVSVFDKLEQSLLELKERFDNFLQQLEGAGWDAYQLKLKVPKEHFIEEVDPIASDWGVEYGPGVAVAATAIRIGIFCGSSWQEDCHPYAHLE